MVDPRRARRSSTTSASTSLGRMQDDSAAVGGAPPASAPTPASGTVYAARTTGTSSSSSARSAAPATSSTSASSRSACSRWSTAPPARPPLRVRGRRREQLLVEPALDLRRGRRPRRLPGRALLHGQRVAFVFAAACSRSSSARPAWPRSRPRRSRSSRPPRSTSSGTRCGASRASLAREALALAFAALARRAARAAEPARARPADDVAPAGYTLTARAGRSTIADRDGEGRRSAREHDELRADRLHQRRPGAGRCRGSRARRSASRSRSTTARGAVLEQWTGPQVAWRMARGYEGAFGRKLNAPYMLVPLCCCSCCRSSTPAGRSGCCTWTCWCCSAFGGLAHLLQQGRHRRSRCRSPTRRCSTCWCGCCGSASARASAPEPLVPVRAARVLALVAAVPGRLPRRR